MTSNNRFDSIDELLDFTKNIKGKKFKDIDINNKLANSKNKGRLGEIVETGFYGYPNNNRAEADFDNLGVELKVSGYTINSKGKVAKERISLSMIDYHEIINEDFEFSKLIFKNKKILIIWYHYERDKPYSEYEITDYQLYDMSKDLEIIKNDFEQIKGKVVDGDAHLISEGDTELLGACTKSSTSKVRRTQPNSSEPAKPRAFSLKHSYIKKIFNERDED
ncbi:MutH/Sau3AI family endonuclease [Methanobrevibacter sp. DSM 116169]|uniref:MutH/Sau3AI family endonuclease n=1 Tax=Methanobrevibacter sp. DSM 116169 TaxID=3242727 RepID=UPI0038FC704F